jgi:UDP-N-acetyl-D-mannosaminuronic acid dehydrogenase
MAEHATKENAPQRFDVAIVGGAGHVGLPLGLVFADVGQQVLLVDVNRQALDQLAAGEMPFMEYDAEPVLRRALDNGTLHFTSDPQLLAQADNVIVTVGTPVDEYLSPKFRVFQELFRDLRPHLQPRQTIIICSTVYPGSCRQLLRYLESDGNRWHLCYCPERIAQGYAVRELRQLPQLVSGFTDESVRRATELFARIAPEVLPLSVEEAELAKLFTNTWRYIQFAAANQFYMTAAQHGADFRRIRQAMLQGYERANTLPGPGFAAGPCLLKDTMQLAAAEGGFLLGHAAMLVNEGLPAFLVDKIKARRRIAGVKVGILGMAFKKDVDDTRDSLSFKLAKVLRFNEADVLCSDEFAQHESFVSKEELIRECEIIIVGVPHTAYKTFVIPAEKDVVDLWGVLPAAANS